MHEDLHALHYDFRDMARMGIVDAVHDAGAIQTVDVTIGAGVSHTQVPVMHFAGFTSVPRVQGVVLLIGVGGDPANMRALPPADTWRFGGLNPGDTVIYAADGTRIELRYGGPINIFSAEAVVVDAPGTMTVNGALHVVGSITATGDITDRLSSMESIRETYDGHTHGDGSTPEPQMPE